MYMTVGKTREDIVRKREPGAGSPGYGNDLSISDPDGGRIDLLLVNIHEVA